MRIKEVCKLTGLTDKAIRLYIDKNLIFPDFSENYMGRKSYSFSEPDIEELKMIATLRKFDFSLSEIEYMLTPEGDVQRVLEDHIEETKEKMQVYSNLINHMINGLEQSPCTPQELCKYLVDSNLEPETILEDNIRSEQETIKQKEKDFLIAIISGVILAGLLLLVAVMYHHSINNEWLNGLIVSVEILCGYKLIQKAFNHLNNPFLAFFYTVIVIYLTVYSFTVYI